MRYSALLSTLAAMCRLSDTASAMPVDTLNNGDAIGMTFQDNVYDPDNSRPVQYYMPAHPLYHDAADYAHLQPTKEGHLYYTKDGHSDHRDEHEFAHLVNSYQYPTVVLEHSQFVSNVGCTPTGQLEVTFNDAEAFKTIRSSWKKKQILITHTHGCLPSTIPEEHSYWLVDRYTYDTKRLVLVASGKQVDINEAIGLTDVKWGTHLPHVKRAGGIAEDETTTDGASTQPTQTAPAGATIETAVVTEGADWAALATATSQGIVTDPTSTASCPAAPAATVRGLPTAPLCEDFDLLLDDTIGYFDFEDEDSFSKSLEEFIPGLDDYDYDTYDGLDDEVEIKIDDLRKRAPAFIEAIGRKTLQLAKATVQITVKAGQAVGSGVRATAQAIKNVPANVKAAAVTTVRVIQEATKVDKSFPLNGLNIEFNTSALAAYESANEKHATKGLVVKETHWGRGARIFDVKKEVNGANRQLSINCVGCGIKSSTKLHGHLIINLAGGGLEKAEVTFGGNITASLGVAIEGNIAWDKDFIDKQIFVVPTPLGFGVANVFRVGLTAGSKVKLNGEIKLQGGMLIGGGATLTNFEIKADLAKLEGSSKNAVPATYGIFDAIGQVGVTVALKFPFDVGVGLVIPPVKVDRQLALVIEPSVEGSATLQLGAYGQQAKCAGVKGEISTKIQVLGDFFGVKKLKLFDYAYKVYEDCLTYKDATAFLKQTAGDVLKGRQLGNSSDPNYFEVPMYEDDGSFEVNPDVLPDVTDEEFLQLLFNPVAAANGTVYTESNLTSVVVTSGYDNSTFGTGEDGNFYLFANDELAESFGYQDGVMPATEEDELMFYYTDAMENLGVSRMRYGNPEDVPVTADFLSLLAINNDDDVSTPSLVLPVNTAGDAFWPVLCDYSDGQYSKFFLVRDLDAGIVTLESEEVRHIVTGGIVSQCQFWELQTWAVGIQF